MKKTFKGYSALIALLIALLVVTAMPFTAMAAEGDEHATGTTVTWTNSSGVIETHQIDRTQGYWVGDPATCQKAGVKRVPCLEPAKHGTTEAWHEIIIDASDEYHNYVPVVSTGSCKTGGTAYEECTYCGAKRNERTIPGQDHKFAAITDLGLKEEKGKIVIEQLKTDPDFVKKNAEAWAKKGFEVTKMPTCKSEGVATFTCSVCGEKATKSIAVVETLHVWDGPIVDKNDKECKAATCAADGKAVHYCIECGTKSYVAIPRLEAQWVTASTELDGCYKLVTYRYCANCEANKADAASVLHPVKADADKKAANAKVEETLEIGAHVFNHLQADFVANGTKEDDGSEKKDSSGKGTGTYNALKSYNVKAEFGTDGKLVSLAAADCETDGRAVFTCSVCHAANTKSEADKAAAYDIVTIKAPGHQWSKWIERYAIGAGENEYAYYIRECSVCHKTEELITKGDPNAAGSGEITPVDPNKYELDAAAVKDGSGTVTVNRVEGNEDIEVSKLFARVTWVYDLADGTTFAYAACVPVEMDGQNIVAKIGKVSTPAGATLAETQIALTDTVDPHMQGEYHQLAGAKA